MLAVIWLLAGLAVFFGVHLIPSCPRSRENLIQRLGEWPYKGVFAVLSVIGLVLIITGMGRAERIVIWHPPAVAGLATAVAMAPALILLVAANFNGHIKRIVRHPMSLGVLLWSVSHLVANGELASLFLFGGFAVFAVLDMFRFKIGSSDRRVAAVPAKPASLTKDFLAVVIGLIGYALLVAFHGSLFGVPIFL